MKMLFILFWLGEISCNLSSTGGQKFSPHFTISNLYQLKSDTSILLLTQKSSANYYYFEIKYNSASNSQINGLINETDSIIKVVYLNQSSVEMEMKPSPMGNISITFPDLDSKNVLSKFTGEFIPNRNFSIRNILNSAHTKKWNEFFSIKDTSNHLYQFPDSSSSAKNFSILKDEFVKQVDELFESNSSISGFVYILSKHYNGWVNSKWFYSCFEKKYQCEEYGNGVIVKDNRKEKYVLYVDQNGNIIKNVNY